MSGLSFLVADRGPANLVSVLSRGLEELTQIKIVENAVRVTTHWTYPSNGLVRVTVRGGTHTIIASMKAAPMGEALSAGIDIKNRSLKLRYLVKDQGLSFEHGIKTRHTCLLRLRH